jgi:hypothetical protein
MPYTKTVVLLFKEPGVTPPFPPQWYRDYFLSTKAGVGAYWLKQSNGNYWFEGDVLGWYDFSANVPPYGIPDFNNRDQIMTAAFHTADAQTGWSQSVLELYDTAIVFVARAGNVRSNTGWFPIYPTLEDRLAGKVVFDTNDTFDFIARELGYVLNLTHSFNDTNNDYGGFLGNTDIHTVS